MRVLCIADIDFCERVWSNRLVFINNLRCYNEKYSKLSECTKDERTDINIIFGVPMKI